MTLAVGANGICPDFSVEDSRTVKYAKVDDQVFPAQKRENTIMGSYTETYPAVAELVCATGHFLPDVSQVPSAWVGAA